MVDLEKFQELLGQYIAFKSISTDPLFVSEIKGNVEWLVKLFKDNGLEVFCLQGENSNPVVVAGCHQSSDLETVLVYGHYDVQPAVKEDGWISDPFTLSIRDGRLYGRGVVDNKGQNLIHVLTVLELIKLGKLKYNVRFVIEGNEETGNSDLSDLIKNNLDKFQSDIVLISDGEIVGDTPTIEASLRGGFSVKIIFKSANDDLHSGIYGGGVPNSAFIASKFVSTLKDSNGKVTIENFYDKVLDATNEEKENFVNLPSDDEVAKTVGVKEVTTEDNRSFYEQTGLRPTIEVIGMHSGYTDSGFKNIIPAKADLRLNFRLVSGQVPNEIYKLFREKLEEFAKDEHITFEIFPTDFYDPVRLDVSSKLALEVHEKLKNIYGRKTIVRYVGGGIPVVSDFQKYLKKDALLIPFGNEDCAMHGANENFRIDLVEKALKFSWEFFSK